jgi:RimJ/RimL family protein N-acetyltransferase
MIKIDWPEKLTFYNRIFNTNYVSVKVMLKNGYKRFGSLKEFAYKLGISDETLRQKLIKENIRINPPIRPRGRRL